MPTKLGRRGDNNRGNIILAVAVSIALDRLAFVHEQ